MADQAYGEFDDQEPSPIFALSQQGNTVVFRTFSKAYAMAGLRVGWCTAAPEVIGQMRKLLNPNNISGVAQAMAAAAMRDQTHMQAIVAHTAQIRDDFTARLGQAGFDLPPSHTNFVLIPFADADAATRADQALRHAGYVLRGMGGYGLSQCLRATVGTADQMAAVAEVLSKMGRTADAG